MLSCTLSEPGLVQPCSQGAATGSTRVALAARGARLPPLSPPGTNNKLLVRLQTPDRAMPDAHRRRRRLPDAPLSRLWPLRSGGHAPMEEDNEADFLTALVASERVAAWLDTLRGFKQHGSLPRARVAVRELKQALEAEVYVQEVGEGRVHNSRTGAGIRCSCCSAGGARMPALRPRVGMQASLPLAKPPATAFPLTL